MTDLLKEQTKPELPQVEREAPGEALPEAKPEVGMRAPEERPEEVGAQYPVLAVPQAPAEAEKDPTLTRVEEVLAEDLAELYQHLPPEQAATFKAKGEEVAGKIREMIGAAKVVAKEVLELIVSWLRLIPGVNKFFLEQEAKIKTDKIIALAEEQKSSQLGSRQAKQV